MPGCSPSSIGPALFVLLSLLSGIQGDCGTPPKLNNAIPQGNADAASFPADTAITYKCLDGFYNIHGKLDVTTCLSNSQWTPIEEFCESSCPEPTSLKYAQPKPEEVNKNYYIPGTTVTYVCRRGYDSIPGMSPVIICLQNNTWAEVPVFCKGKSCGDPGKPQNGRAVVLTDLLYRAKVNFTCDDGYRLIGAPFTQCLTKSNTVKWNKEPPDCQLIACSSPPNITGGTHDGGESFENFTYNSTVTYQCNRGFLLIGEASIHCTTEDKIKGIWSGPAPECKAMITTPMPSTSQEAEKLNSSGLTVKLTGDTTINISGSTYSTTFIHVNTSISSVEKQGQQHEILISTSILVMIFLAVVPVVIASGIKVSRRKKGFYNLNQGTSKHTIL